ncbi:GntR family transcriptional regulator [candidate division KSB1 bacterium]
MLLNLTDQSSESLQDQIIRQIRAKILRGELLPDDGLPSIRVFARKNHVSVITVQRSYERLLNEGLIHSRRNRGFFISELSDSKKSKLAQQRLIENIEPVIYNAVNEGMIREDISNLINNVLKNIKKGK